MQDKYLGSHEFQPRAEDIKTSSDRAFGGVFAAFCAIVGALGVYRGSAHWPWWLAFAAGFGLLALLRPQWLAPFNRMWTRLGLLLSAVVSPLALGIVFYLCVAPIGWIIRLAGKDPLSLRIDRAAASYWIRREPPGPPPETLPRQF